MSNISLWYSAVISNASSCRVWSQVSASLANIRSVFSQNEKVAEGLKQFTLKLASPAAERIGWEFKPGEDYLIVQLRKLLIGMACNAGHEG